MSGLERRSGEHIKIDVIIMLQKEKELNGEQRAIVDECIKSPSLITIIQGKAGSGKSFLVKELEKVSGLLKDNYNIDINDESMRYINGFGSDISHADCQTVKDYSRALVSIYEKIGAYGRKAFVTDPLHGYPLKGSPKQMLEEKKEQKSKIGGFFRKVLGIKLILIAIVMMCFVSCGNKLDDQETILEMIAILNENNEKPKG